MPDPGGSRYAEHLARGLAAYEARTGRRPRDAALDVSRPEVRALYDRFRSRPFGRSLGATQGEWAQLRLGLKQVLRERLDEAGMTEVGLADVGPRLTDSPWLEMDDKLATAGRRSAFLAA